MSQPPKPDVEHVYRKKDFTEESVARLYANFAGGLVKRYLQEEQERYSHVERGEYPRSGRRLGGGRP